MLRLLLLLALFSGLSCSKDQPLMAPAGKKTGDDFADLFDAFDALQAADSDTAADSTASAAADSSVASDSTSASVPDSSVFSPTAAVSIPDKALRRYLEKVLKKNRGATITHADMRTIVSLLLGHGLGIKSLVGLEAATSLQHVAMNGNQISDVSPLANLPKLRYLYIRGNPLSDASINEHIPALERRGVEVIPSYLVPPDAVLIPDPVLRTAIELILKKERGQPISQAEMKEITSLWLAGHKVKSLIGLEAATNLQTLDLRSNPLLNDVSLNEHIPALRRRGVEVFISPYERTFPDSPFDIELVFVADFTEMEKKIVRQAANRWEAAIQADIPDYTFSEPQSIGCGNFFTIPAGERIDDLRIYVTKFPDEDGAPRGFMSMDMDFVRSSGLPLANCIQFNERIQYDYDTVWLIALHEIGHALGIGIITDDTDMFHNPETADAHFAGPQAIAAFDQAGGTNFQGGKVPMTPNGSHWDLMLVGEIMGENGNFRHLSAITLGALSDLGYTVDFLMADHYELPPLGAAKPVADAVPFCLVERLHTPVYVGD